MEFILKTDLQKELPDIIDFNHEELKAELSANLEKYNKLVVTEDTIKYGKADKAMLNKLRTAIEDKRKEVKKLCLAPCELFEAKIKEIVALIDKPIACIDGQVKEFEEQAKKAKRLSIEDCFNFHKSELDILLSTFWNDKWLNATYKFEEIEKEIKETIETANTNIKIIKDLKSEFEYELLQLYLQTLNMQVTLIKKTSLEQQKAKAEEYNRQKTEIAPQVEITTVADVVESIDNSNFENSAIEPIATLFEEEITFKVWVTEQQKSALRDFLIVNQILYES